jgi:transcriptional regulator with XRE-family HTH domain
MKSVKSFNVLLTRRMEQMHLTTADLAARCGMTVKDAWDLRRGVVFPDARRIAELAPLMEISEQQLRAAIEEQRNRLT